MTGFSFFSTAPAATSLRSTCGSERGKPECSKQRTLAATPHVGQGTEDNCFSVRSAILIQLWCDKTSRNAVPFGTVHILARGDSRPAYFLGFARGQWDALWNTFVAKDQKSRRATDTIRRLADRAGLANVKAKRTGALSFSVLRQVLQEGPKFILLKRLARISGAPRS
jgi:hypothetical protein